MNYSKGARFFPNECHICKTRKELKRCECNMIAYCGEDHRLQNLPVHESFCKAVRELLKERRLSHVYEETFPLFGSDWIKKTDEISGEIIKKLGRCMSPLEITMRKRPRVCFVCREFKQEELNNCPGCPVATFCKLHPNNEIHSENCAVMTKYLNLLTTADELNIDLQFLSSNFPYITEEKKIGIIDRLSYTFKLSDTDTSSLQSRLLKLNLFDFIDSASKLHIALQKIYKTIPLEIIIHLDAQQSKHAIVKENYWEFLLHLNPDIKILKIVITGSENMFNLETSLCEKCRFMEKNLSIEIHSTPYEHYMLQEDYQKPNFLFYCRTDDEKNSARTNRWNQINCPIVLPIVSELNFHETKSILVFSTANKFKIIYGGQIFLPFSDKTLPGNDDYIMIFKAKGITNKRTKYRRDNTNMEGIISKRMKLTEEMNPEEVKSLSSSSSSSSSNSDDNCSNEIDEQNKNLEPSSKFRVNDSNCQINLSQTYLMKHVTYLQHENDGLRQQLNSSVQELTKQQEKILELEKICFHLNEKNKIIRNISRDIVSIIDIDDEDLGSLLEKKNFGF
ncbi:uncharacterized protein LOC127289413 [Leptopilina boulardi]|uniref:uncharacterized protein LOC127289413 n=1 Tax=Leptopilina boulardi TaxID=63433 RepID=UPI0021F573E2|nr:uncharacterized protein LOC127289413 [Leptopilina boulardi]